MKSCNFCNQSFDKLEYVGIHDSKKINILRYACHTCNFFIHFNGDGNTFENISYIIYFNKYSLLANMTSNIMYFTVYKNVYTGKKITHQLPKAFPLQYIISNSKENIFTRLNNLITYL